MAGSGPLVRLLRQHPWLRHPWLWRRGAKRAKRWIVALQLPGRVEAQGGALAGELSNQGTVMLQVVLIWLVVGAIVGWLASQIMSSGGLGLQGDILIGVVGGLVGGVLLPQMGFLLGGTVLGHIINGSVGAVIATFVGRMVKQSQSSSR
jgi:uncharacterized membrane protein YeaQ/YmgE (transglycosylase-associated protein family)